MLQVSAARTHRKVVPARRRGRRASRPAYQSASGPRSEGVVNDLLSRVRMRDEGAQRVLGTQAGDLGEEPYLVDDLLTCKAIRGNPRDTALDIDAPAPVIDVVFVGSLAVTEQRRPGLVPNADIPLDVELLDVPPQSEDATAFVR